MSEPLLVCQEAKLVQHACHGLMSVTAVAFSLMVN